MAAFESGEIGPFAADVEPDNCVVTFQKLHEFGEIGRIGELSFRSDGSGAVDGEHL